MLHSTVLSCALAAIGLLSGEPNVGSGSSEHRIERTIRTRLDQRVGRGDESFVQSSATVAEVGYRTGSRRAQRLCRKRSCCAPAPCPTAPCPTGPAPAPGDPHEVDADCRYASVMKIGTSCYWIHLNCATGFPYSSVHQRWEPCGSNSCQCSGRVCTDPEALAAIASEEADDPYAPIDPLTDFTDKGVQDKFDDPKWHSKRTIHYAKETKGLKVTLAGSSDTIEVQLVKVKAKLKQNSKNKTFWVGYEVTTAAAEHDVISGAKHGNTVILKEDDLNALGVDVDEDMVVILKGFVASVGP